MATQVCVLNGAIAHYANSTSSPHRNFAKGADQTWMTHAITVFSTSPGQSHSLDEPSFRLGFIATRSQPTFLNKKSYPASLAQPATQLRTFVSHAN